MSWKAAPPCAVRCSWASAASTPSRSSAACKPATRSWFPAATCLAMPSAFPSTDPFAISILIARTQKKESAMLEMRQVSKIYRTEQVETHALRSLDLHVRDGEFVAVTGPSGSGKTTFLNIAGLLETFTSGQFLLDGQDVSDLNDDARSRMRNQ